MFVVCMLTWVQVYHVAGIRCMYSLTSAAVQCT